MWRDRKGTFGAPAKHGDVNPQNATLDHQTDNKKPPPFRAAVFVSHGSLVVGSFENRVTGR